jgi:hypothetical protein
MIESNLELYNDILQKVQFFYKSLKLKRQEKEKGRKLAISIPEIIALALYKQSNGIPTKKAVHKMFQLPCSYKTLVVNMNRFASLSAVILLAIIQSNRALQHFVKHIDSTDIPVCSNRKAKRHTTMKMFARWGHTGKGAFYGLKLHITTDIDRRLLALRLTTGATDDRACVMEMNNGLDGIFIADAGYVSENLAYEFHREGRRYLFTKTRSNMKKVTTWFQAKLYETRMMIEINFRNLKCFYNLITSLPRSVNGYLANYIHSLLAYVLV